MSSRADNFVVRLLSRVQLFASTSGFLVHHLLEFAQTHVHCVSDVIQPSCPLSSSSPPAFYLSQIDIPGQILGTANVLENAAKTAMYTSYSGKTNVYQLDSAPLSVTLLVHSS